MRHTLIPCSLLCSTVLSWVLLAGSCQAQSLVFASPNTREHMTDEAAWNSLDSFEQSNFLAVARYFAGKLCARPEIWTSEGLDGGNTENSSVVTGCSGRQARYLGELLGRYAHQQWILIFDPGREGKERLLIVAFATEHPAEIAGELRRSGITSGSIVVQDKTIRLYLWVKDHSQDGTVQAFVSSHQGTLKEIAGKAMLIGNADRRKSQIIFDQRIGSYEQAHHLSLSRLLWSRRLRDLGLTSRPTMP